MPALIVAEQEEAPAQGFVLGSTIAALAHIRAVKAPFGNASGGPRRRRKVARCEGLSSLVNVKLSIEVKNQ